MKNVYVFGSSFAENRFSEKKQGIKTWGQSVADEFGFDNVEYRGEGATGNNRIAYKIFEQVLKFHDKIDLALIWWSTWICESFFCGEYNFTTSLMKSYKFNEKQKDQALGQHEAFMKALTSYNHKNLPHHIVNRNIIDNFVKTQKILEYHDIPYIMIQGDNPILYWYPELGEPNSHSGYTGSLTTFEEDQELREFVKYDKIVELIEDQSHYINEKTFIWYPGIPELGGTNWNFKNTYEPGFNQKHTNREGGKPTQEGHDYIASLFIERYKNLYA